MNTYRFYKTGREWFIDLPEYLAQGGAQGDLQMVDGADTMLDIVSEGGNDVTLQIATQSFAGADLLTLTEKCDPYIGGGYYHMQQYNGTTVDANMWLCQVTEFVFGGLPEEIWVRRG